MKTQQLLIIFTKNPELGKCKTRLAKAIGHTAALNIYKFLLQHTANITKNLSVDKHVYYSENIILEDDFCGNFFSKKLQHGNDLGEKMSNAFQEAFQQGYKNVILIGSDLLDLSTAEISEAFLGLEENEFVLGPAKDGGYYLIGMASYYPKIFQQKKWSTSSVLKHTLEDLKNKKVTLLSERNDIDEVNDIPKHSILESFYK